ncbi:HIT domain-containing protein [Natrinema thermotolerans]|uniref:HIT domain-containing protein n=1 Tax=Natrinema thermotolerans TaxID=121872 RepID=A0AAF0PB22_9EURY|nr:HIT domain-containing protein [Natrinema thermotolerans]ELZ18579.1 histidine triad protein [Natrinema thermotolerans DSM 11552]QCC59256.1 HIT domain-containing protein [Natrinema thermotolerans]WMT06219.1 HIT domain-containing protein [Natrinema thermotolerans]
MHDDCEFCRIVAGEQAAHVLYEDERTLAFLDENPATPGHTLIVPRAHAEEVVTADEPTAAAVFETVRTVATALESVLEPDGFSVFHTSGPLVGSVDHAHVHLVPRRTDDDVRLSLSRTPLEPDAAADLTGRVRSVL